MFALSTALVFFKLLDFTASFRVSWWRTVHAESLDEIVKSLFVVCLPIHVYIVSFYYIEWNLY